METLLAKEFLQVRYIKLHFALEMTEDTVLPVQKASALRGGMGEMLLQINCIRDRKCDACEFEEECIVRRVMYSKMRIQPEFMSAGDSVGYVIDCENYREEFHAGDLLEFDLLLFGRMAVYFGQILQAFQYLGVFGLGKHKAHYRIARVTNSHRQDILSGNDIYMSRVELQQIADYVLYRKRRAGQQGRLNFHTPLTLKNQGVFLKEFEIGAVLKAIERRLYMLNCYEGIDAGRIDTDTIVPLQISQRAKPFSVKRYSSTHEQKIRLDGICGNLVFEDAPEMAAELLLAGELIHIGKNTSFGFGRYSFLNREEA